MRTLFDTSNSTHPSYNTPSRTVLDIDIYFITFYPIPSHYLCHNLLCLSLSIYVFLEFLPYTIFIAETYIVIHLKQIIRYVQLWFFLAHFPSFSSVMKDTQKQFIKSEIIKSFHHQYIRIINNKPNIYTRISYIDRYINIYTCLAFACQNSYYIK